MHNVTKEMIDAYAEAVAAAVLARTRVAVIETTIGGYVKPDSGRVAIVAGTKKAVLAELSMVDVAETISAVKHPFDPRKTDFDN